MGQQCVSVSSVRELKKMFGNEESVILTQDGSTIVCWHPQPIIPYQCTMPLPDAPPESDTILKVQDKEDKMKQLFNKKQHPFFINKALRELTYTTKHIWFPKPDKRYFKKGVRKSREYL
ncbi:hypothetical protein Pmani_035730 [Petrolisthes manimaculis]|uniref:Large ribosomal subunit protein mL42 n=1 Tax=Petrolisthes manimaculis TaxID=1843537 RepID=A0AAE1NL23_9EUCA|nr:hypothetical protein Pmani_035730 [Petrolisthes manimaculis]